LCSVYNDVVIGQLWGISSHRMLVSYKESMSSVLVELKIYLGY